MHNSFYSRSAFWFFLTCWIGGLFLGVFAAAQAERSVVSLMHPLFFGRVSIVLLAVLFVLPLLITAWSVMIQKIEILWFTLFCRCFAYGFFIWLQVRAFGSASWLTVGIGGLPEMLSLAAFSWYALECTRSFKMRRKSFGICLCITFLAVIADYFIVSQFFAMLYD